MLARARFPDLQKNWIDVSLRVGGLLPKSRLLVSVQRVGDLDMLLRAIEDEWVSAPVKPGDAGRQSAADLLSCHYQLMLSELWVSSAYEIFRLLKARKLADGNAFNALAHDFRLLRVPLEKHEIVEDGKLSAPLLMQNFPPDKENPEIRAYDKNDTTRAHIMPTGLSERGSLMWLVFDHRANKQFWIERRALSERIIALWPVPTSMG